VTAAVVVQSQIPSVIVYAFDEWSQMLHQAPALRPPLFDALMVILKRVRDASILHNHRLVVVDYSLPSNQKRLWVFDLNTRELLAHTYVSHGIKSGELFTDHFSNRYNSKASSLGLYRTGQVYYGREGLTLKLHGLDRGFNDNAENRAIVMHGAWYMDEAFIRKYGRSGRSWGCPALPLDMNQSVIHAIKDGALLVMYYPSARWYSTSAFLRDEAVLQVPQWPDVAEKIDAEDDSREPVLWVQQGAKQAAREAVLAMPADDYTNYFHVQVPLERMLRRQISGVEYIALTPNELQQLQTAAQVVAGLFDALILAEPSIKMVRGYYQTEMKTAPLGKVKTVEQLSNQPNHFVLHMDNNSTVTLRPVNVFIRWVGV
jgi:hypothetical protein